jgi:hypothetical protein
MKLPRREVVGLANANRAAQARFIKGDLVDLAIAASRPTDLKVVFELR